MVLEEERRRAGQDSLIMEMVTGPAEQVAPCIRNALERGWEKGLPANLSEFQQKRSEEIERVCSRYYAEFLGSVQELLTAKSRSAALRQQIVRFNEDIRVTGQETLKTGYELQKHKAAKRNITAASAVINQCRELTSLMVTAKQQIEDSKYYPALSTVDSIRQQLSTAYDQPFIHRVKLWLPELSNQIKAAALRDVGQWLVTTRANSVAVGKGALRKCTNFMTGLGWEAGDVEGPQSTPARQILQQIEHVVNFSSWTTEDELLPFIPPFLHTADGDELQMFNSLPESVAPLHRALYIHAHLGALDEIRTYYHNNRLVQAAIPTSAPAATPDEFVTQFQETIFYTTGFFVTEYTTLRSTEYPEGLISPAKIEDTWAAIQKDLCLQVDKKAATLTSPAHFLQLKQSLLLLAFTLGEDCFHFNTGPILDLIKSLKDRFLAVQLGAIASRCTTILQEEVYQPLSVQSDKEYRAVILPFGIDRQDNSSSEPLLLEEVEPVLSPSTSRRGGTSAVRYPRTFAFSAVVPRLCVELYRMVLLCFLFSLQLSIPSMETAVHKLIDEALKKIVKLLDAELTSGLQEDTNFPISKACQISVDSATLAKMTTDFEKMVQYSIARLYSTEAANKIPELMQRAKREFENMAIAAQQLVPELIRRKIDELLGGMSFIEWEAPAIITRPRDYIDDVITYLQVTFMCLTYLPKMAREVIHFASCSHISLVMSSALMDPKQVPKINTNGLYNFSVDLAALEDFADSCAVMQLRECFAELRQTLGAMLHRDIDTIMKDAVLREGVLPKLNASKLVVLLDKYRPQALLSQVRNQQRQDAPPDLPYLDKKKVAEYIKALKQQGYA